MLDFSLQSMQEKEEIPSKMGETVVLTYSWTSTEL